MDSDLQRSSDASSGSRSQGPKGGLARGLTPKSCVQGVLRTPGSKSAAQRALIAALLAEGETRIHGIPDGADVTAAIALVSAAGADLTWLFGAEQVASARGVESGSTDDRGKALRILGQPPLGLGGQGGPAPHGPLNLGESGTLARLATAALALCGRPGGSVLLTAQGSLLTRSSRALFRCLQSAGVEILEQNVQGTWPVNLKSVSAPSTLRLTRPSSSQEVSALLIAAAAWPDTIHVEVLGNIPSLPYVNLTRQLLEEFSVSVEEEITGEPGREEHRTYLVNGPLIAPPGPLFLEPDASSAAVVLTAACLSGGSITVPGLTLESAQGDVRIVEHLRTFGCDASADAKGIHARGFPTRGAEIHLRGEPDLAPVLAVIAAASALRGGTSSLLLGLDTLPGKESDRIAVLAAGLRAVGLRVETGDDRIAIGPPASSPGNTTGGNQADAKPLLLDPQGDHRMAFAFALLGLVVERIYVTDPECVSKSWRGFWGDICRVGAEQHSLE